jgi:formate hydrogenlyase subunit 3/multisubunit Na+/H+ antiporter MnhD subunit
MTATLLMAALLWPVTLSLLWLLPSVRRRTAALAATMAWPALLLAFSADAALQIRAPGLFTTMSLGVDPVGRAFLLLTALLWSVVGVYAHVYMRRDTRRAGFTAFLLVTGTANIGLTLAQDMLSFYLFFSIMTFAAYGLIIHSRAVDALRAGRIYIIMAVLGEALLLAGVFTLTGMAADTTFGSVPDAYRSLPAPGLAASLFLLGFGVKAGLVPLHMWLPLAHPIAPTPASALLSGAMIKAGVLGWLRFLPIGELALPGPGTATMTAGVAATIVAAAIGITQRDPKTVLAYSSISQMGFLTVGIGAALLLPAAAPLLVMAVAVYALHHAPAKAALFLGVGLVRGRDRPWMLAVAALPALALAGAPLTSGAVAKAALKTGLGELPLAWRVPVDLLLAIAAVGTTLLMARYLAALLATDAPAPGSNAAPGQAAPAAPAAPARGLLLSWLLLSLLSAAAAVWLPYTLTPLGELPLATQPQYIAAALWPVALGVLLAAASFGLARWYPALALRPVPAGDIIVLAEHGTRAARLLARRVAALPLEQHWTRVWQGGNRAAGLLIDRAAVMIERMAAGPALGAVLCALAVLLFLALR